MAGKFFVFWLHDDNSFAHGPSIVLAGGYRKDQALHREMKGW